MTIYVDVLVALNLYINFFLLYSTALFLKRRPSRLKLVLSAFVGALGALIILAPPLGYLLSALYKIALGALMTFIAFGKQKPSDFAVSALFFILVNFIFAGAVNAFWTFFSPLEMVCENGVFYFDIPVAAVIAFTAAAFFLIKLVKFIASKNSRINKFCEVKIISENAEITLNGLCDTGCDVKDIFTGTPVVICAAEKITKIIPQSVNDYFNGGSVEKIRLIPLNTVSDETLIPVFRPQQIIINGKSADALIGVSGKKLGDDVDCVLNPEIISI